jgi:hypothetical protein
MTALADAPERIHDIPEWLGIEVLPGPAEPACILRMRQLGKQTWSQRPGTPQELRLYRALVAVTKTVPDPARDVVLDVERLHEAFGTDNAPLPADAVLVKIRRLRDDRDTARAAVEKSNEDVIQAVERMRSVRAQGSHPAGSTPYLRREGELNAFDMVLRLLKGQSVSGGGARDDLGFRR